MKEFWISAYDQMGRQFGATIEAESSTEALREFERKYEDSEVADYGEYEDVAAEDEDYTPSATAGDYSPSNPWDAPGMSIHDFI